MSGPPSPPPNPLPSRREGRGNLFHCGASPHTPGIFFLVGLRPTPHQGEDEIKWAILAFAPRPSTEARTARHALSGSGVERAKPSSCKRGLKAKFSLFPFPFTNWVSAWITAAQRAILKPA